MSKTLTETASDDSVSVPEDGVDPRTAASIEPAFQALANKARKGIDDAAAVAAFGHIREIGHVGDGAGNPATVHQTISSTSFTDVTGASVTLSNVQAGDRLIVIASLTISHSNAEDKPRQMFLRLTKESASVAKALLGDASINAEVRGDGSLLVGNWSGSFFGSEVAGFSEAYTFKLQGADNASAAGDLQISNNWNLFAIAIKPQV